MPEFKQPTNQEDIHRLKGEEEQDHSHYPDLSFQEAAYVTQPVQDPIDHSLPHPEVWTELIPHLVVHLVPIHVWPDGVVCQSEEGLWLCRVLSKLEKVILELHF